MAEYEITDEKGGKRKVSLIDVQQVLESHEKDYPLETSQGYLIFRCITVEAHERIKEHHNDWLVKEGFNTIAESQRIIEKGKDKLTEGDKHLLADFATRTWPYSSEVIHAMLAAPEMTLETCRNLLLKLSPEDLLKVQQLCDRIMRENYLNLKN